MKLNSNKKIKAKFGQFKIKAQMFNYRKKYQIIKKKNQKKRKKIQMRSKL